MTGRRRLRVCVHGVVQGVGFRPFVYTCAAAAGLTGSVRNDSSGAIIEVEGDETGRRRVPDAAARTAAAARGDRRPSSTGHSARRWHRLRASPTRPGRTVAARSPPPTSRCAPTVRPSCATRPTGAIGTRSSTAPTAVPGSRSSRSLPYDRAATTMARFPMCADCAREYADPTDRRFHAQPVCCPNCGPPCAIGTHDGGSRRRRGRPAPRPAAAARRRHPRASRASAAITWPATRPTKLPWPNCVDASAAATSRSR